MAAAHVIPVTQAQAGILCLYPRKGASIPQASTIEDTSAIRRRLRYAIAVPHQLVPFMWQNKRALFALLSREPFP